MKRTLQTLFVFVLLLCLVAADYGTAGGAAPVFAKETKQDPYTYTQNAVTATDALGRTLPGISGYRDDRYVGVFYFLWHGQHAADTARNVTELLKTNYNDLFDASTDNKVVPYNSWLHYQEPLFGYYNSMDEWVMRKHIEMFIASGVDFLTLDFTNGIYYNRPLMQLFNLLREYKDAGWDVPQVMFYVNANAQALTRQIYTNIYQKDKYKDLVFYGKSKKPLIVSVPHELDDELKAYFDVRASQWHINDYGDQTWPYWRFTREWHKYTDMVSVSVAQSGTSFSFVFEGYEGKKREAWGRGYSSKNPKNGDVNAILRGDNFQEGWDAAIKLDPTYVFLTGWNEWVMQKMNLHTFFPDEFEKDFPCYTDNFNVEFSRDIEMTKDATYVKGKDGSYVKEGYGDNYFLQMAANIRRFKGIARKASDFTAPASATIDLDGDASQWDAIPEKYVAFSTKKIARNAQGFYQDTSYKQAKPDNFVKEVQVTYDADNVYFRIETESAVTKHQTGKTNWMNLFIGVENSKKPAWETFNYVINRNPVSDTKTSLERFTKNGSYATEKVGEIDYRVNGNVMQIAVPYSMLGIKSGQYSLLFKVADSIQKESDILDYYVSGESFPLGRMAFTYETSYVERVSPDEPYVPAETPASDTAEKPSPLSQNSQLRLILEIVIGAVIVGGLAFIVIVLANRKKK